MLRALATAMLLLAVTPCLAQDAGVDALYEKWKKEDARTLEGWRVLDDPKLIEKLGPRGLALTIDGAGENSQGNPKANYLLSMAYSRGIGGAPVDRLLANRYLHAAGALRKDDVYAKARTYFMGTYDSDAILDLTLALARDDWTLLARQGEDGYAAAYLLCTAGEGFGLPGERKVDYLKLASDAGCLPAMTLFGREKLTGAEVERDKSGGLALLNKAADGGNRDALHELARFYDYPNGQQPDLKLCRDYLRRAADTGDLWAIRELEGLPDVELATLSVNQLYELYIDRWPAPVMSKTAYLLEAPPNPVLVSYPKLGSFLKGLVEPGDDNILSEESIAKAQIMYGECLFHGVGGVDQDIELAGHWLYQVTKTEKYPASSLLYAEYRMQTGPRKVATVYFSDATKAEFRPALRYRCQISLMSLRNNYSLIEVGEHVLSILELEEAEEALVEFASNGDTVAAGMLASRSDKLKPEWLPWMETAARSGDARCAMRLARYHAEPDHADTAKELSALKIAAQSSEMFTEATARLAFHARASARKRCAELAEALEQTLVRDATPSGYLAENPWIAGVAQLAATDDADCGLYGLCLMYGHGVTRDYAEARKRLTKLADEAIPSFLLATMMEQGLGADRDVRGATWVYEAVAGAGGVYAMHRLGEIKRAAKDDEKATEWFKQAAEGGCLPSMVELAKSYRDGVGIAKDAAKAKEWAKKAADAGNAAAKKLLEEWK